ncbi:TPA: glycosyl hydrolase 108 family protein, partial [Escherichia coli]
MKSKDKIFDEVLGKEGGYVNHPDDKGGPTKWGITEKVARAHGYRGDMRDLTREQALDILEADYWYGPRFDQVAALSPDIAAELCDTGVNMGPTVASRMLQRWLNVFNLRGRLYPVIIMDSIDQAYPMLEAIKAELEFNPRLKNDFPEVCGQGRVWRMGTIVTANNIKVTVAGSGKKLRGLRHGPYRPDLVILDDIENDEMVRNPEQRDKLHDWLTKTVMPLGEAGGKTDIIYIGTILHYDSVLSRTLNNPMWKTARFKAVIQWPANMKLWDEWEELIRNKQPEAAEALYRQNEADMLAGSVVSWAARPLLALMKIRVRDGHDTFDSEYQNDPVSGEDALFAGCIKFWVNRLDEWVFYGAVDPSLGKKNKNRDPS